MLILERIEAVTRLVELSGLLRNLIRAHEIRAEGVLEESGSIA